MTGDWPSELQIERDGGARYPEVEVDEYLSQRNALSAPVDALSTVASGLQNDCAVGLDVGWRQNDDVNFTKHKGGHGVTVWGYYYDSAANASSPERYADLIISCSDDAKTNYRWRTALDYDAGSGRYLIKDYDSDGAEDSLYGVWEYFCLLKPNDGAEPTDGLVVTTNADVVDANDGVTSLREAIAAAQTGDMIRFAPSLKGKTITLTRGQLEITQGITVDAGALYDEATQTPESPWTRTKRPASST